MLGSQRLRRPRLGAARAAFAVPACAVVASAAWLADRSSNLIRLDVALCLGLWWFVGRRSGLAAAVAAGVTSAVLASASAAMSAPAVLVIVAATVAGVSILAVSGGRALLDDASGRRPTARAMVLLGALVTVAVLDSAVSRWARPDASRPGLATAALVGAALASMLALAWRGEAGRRNESGLAPVVVVLLALSAVMGASFVSWERAEHERFTAAVDTAAVGFFTGHSDVLNTLIVKAGTASRGSMGAVSTFGNDLQTAVFANRPVSAAAYVDVAPDGASRMTAILSRQPNYEQPLAAALGRSGPMLARVPATPLPIDLGILDIVRPEGGRVPHFVLAVEVRGPQVDAAAGHRRFLVFAMSFDELLNATTAITSFPDVVFDVVADGTSGVHRWSTSPEGVEPADVLREGGSATALLGGSNVTVGGRRGDDFGPSTMRRSLTLAAELVIAALILAVLLRLAEVQVMADRDRRHREVLLRAALDATPGRTALFDEQGKVVMANREAIEQSAVPVVGAAVADVLGLGDGDPSERRSIDRAVHDALRGVESRLEHAEESNDRRGGLRIDEIFVRPIAGPGSGRAGFIQSIDVTERRELAMRSARSERLEALGALAGGMAHDFNNLLFVTMGNLQMLAMEPVVSADAKLTRFVARSTDAVQRGTSITRSLLTLARSQPLEESTVELAGFFADLLPLVQQAVGRQRTVEVHLDDALPEITVDAGRLSSSVLNLVFNARDAMGASGRLRITASMATEPGDDDLAPGPYLCITIADDGTGMSTETLGRAFEPFFTTKRAGSGTGLGLSTVYAFTRQSRGTTRIVSAPGVGTEVSLVFPIGDGPVVRRSDAVVGELTGMRVMVVDDEAALAELICAWLVDLGATARSATTPADAMELVCEFEPQVLVSDVQLGADMDGLELSERCLAVVPDLQIVFVTGFSDRMRELQRRGARTLAKPFSQDDLRAALGSLDRVSSGAGA